MMREELCGLHLRDQHLADYRNKRRAAYEAVLMMSEDVCSAMDDVRMAKSARSMPASILPSPPFVSFITPVSPVHESRPRFDFECAPVPASSASLESVLSDLDASLRKLQSRLSHRRSDDSM
jgi:hypothetical protein